MRSYLPGSIMPKNMAQINLTPSPNREQTSSPSASSSAKMTLLDILSGIGYLWLFVIVVLAFCMRDRIEIPLLLFAVWSLCMMVMSIVARKTGLYTPLKPSKPLRRGSPLARKPHVRPQRKPMPLFKKLFWSGGLVLVVGYTLHRAVPYSQWGVGLGMIGCLLVLCGGQVNREARRRARHRRPD